MRRGRGVSKSVTLYSRFGGVVETKLRNVGRGDEASVSAISWNGRLAGLCSAAVPHWSTSGVRQVFIHGWRKQPRGLEAGLKLLQNFINWHWQKPKKSRKTHASPTFTCFSSLVQRRSHCPMQGYGQGLGPTLASDREGPYCKALAAACAAPAPSF